MRFIILFVCAAFLSDANAHRYAGDEKKEVYFITPSDGVVTTNPVKIKFGATGINIVPAGIDMPDSGHHHLLINVDKLPDLKLPIPADSNHLHFGNGQTETELNFPKGNNFEENNDYCQVIKKTKAASISPTTITIAIV